MKQLRPVLCAATSVALFLGASLAEAQIIPNRNGSAACTIAATSDTIEQVIFSDGFESVSGPWTFDGEGWGRTGYRSASGSFSAYCSQTLVAPPGPYPDYVYTAMTAGPFDLSDCDAARIDFQLWLDCEADFDEVYVYASPDGEWLEGASFSWGGGGWQSAAIDVSALAGQSAVWITFEFWSDDVNGGEGAYVDNVRLVGSRTNHAPIARGESYGLEMDEALSKPAPGVLVNDQDEDGDRLEAHLSRDAVHGNLVLLGDGSFTYTPDPGFLGDDSFAYYVTDPSGKSSSSCEVQLTVHQILPRGGTDAYSVRIGTTLSVVAPGVLANDSDRLGRALTATQTQPALHGMVTLCADGSFTYTPEAGFIGWDYFAYRAVAVPDVLSDFVGVQIFVSPEPVQPIARFYNRIAGTHFYTADPQEIATLLATRSHIYSFEGTAYTLNPERNDTPLYRFYRPASGTHFYTADPYECARVQQTMGATYAYEGIAYNVSADSAGGSRGPVYRFYNTRNGTHFYTADPAEMENVKTNLGNIYSYDGIAFYLGQ